MKRKIVFLLHLAYWLIYLLLLLIIISVASLQLNQKPSVFNILIFTPIGFLCLFPNFISFYIFYSLLFERFLSRGKIAALIFYGSLTCLFSALVGAFALLIQFRTNKPVFTEAGSFSALMIWLFLVAAIHGGIALVIKGFVTWFDEIKIKEELAAKNYEMELELVKSQINPHFLFNTINNIDVLITIDSTKASEYLNKLSDILRYMVYKTKTEKIPLADELSYIEKYLELQRIRTSNLDYINFEIVGNAGNLTIAPMILFPFIENAFKHTEHKKSTSKINIEVLIEERKLVFKCENNYQEKNNEEVDGGLGNELIERRLMLLYAERFALETEKDASVYKVKLTLDPL